ncbi:MAG: hypothetical protein V3T86_08355 [Planctomycetota bacterium]
MQRLFVIIGVAAAASVAGAFLISSSGTQTFRFERLPDSRTPMDFRVDTDAISGIGNPVGVAQELMDQWDAIAGADNLFGDAALHSSYTGVNAMTTFGRFTDSNHELAWDADGSIMQAFSIDPSVLGITIKSVSPSNNILDVVVVINTTGIALSEPGTGATREELFRSTLLHELGHVAALGHSVVGIANTSTGFGLLAAQPADMPTMFPFRIPSEPQAGGTLSDDDRAAMRNHYSGDTSSWGTLRGTIRSVSGAPANQIAVRAVSEDGTIHVGRLSDSGSEHEGRFRIPHMPPGGYRVVIETINGRANLDPSNLSTTGEGLGANPFVAAQDELWRLGDTYDPALDPPATGDIVQVRAGRTTSFIDFILDGAPIVRDDMLAGTISTTDSRVSNQLGSLSYVDYFVFAGTAGQTARIEVAAASFVPQLRLLRPSDLDLEDADTPINGAAILNTTLAETGIYTIQLYARRGAGSPGSTGSYSIELTGAGASLPAAPTNTNATIVLGPNTPGDESYASPACERSLMQLRLTAPALEELWVDSIRLRTVGSGNEALDVDRIAVVSDQNGNGVRDSGEPVIGSGTPTMDNGTITISGLDVELNAGASEDLIVMYDVTVESVVTAGPTASWVFLAFLPAFYLLARFTRGRKLAWILIAALALPISCGGGGGGDGGGGGLPANCNQEFDPAGTAVTFSFTVEPGDIEAYTPTSDPSTPLGLPTATLNSSNLTLSQ